MKSLIPSSKRLYKQENLKPTIKQSGNVDPITKYPGWPGWGIFAEYEGGRKKIKLTASYINPDNYLSYFGIENNSSYFNDSDTESYYEII